MFKCRIFQYHLLNNSLVNNYWLCKWKIKDSLCSFCNDEPETSLHLFWTCDKTQLLYKEFEEWLNNVMNEHLILTMESVLLGDVDFGMTENICILELKRYIYSCRKGKS